MTFIDTILQNLSARPAQSLLVEMHGGEAKPVTNLDTATRVARARGTLRLQGISPGDRVALLAPNSAAWAAADLAILAEGAVVVPLYVRQAASELLAMIKDAGVRTILAADDTVVAPLRAAGLGTDVQAAVVTFDALFAGVAAVEAPRPRAEGDVVTIIYTSGTGGAAKGVMLTAGNVDYMLPITRDAIARLAGGADVARSEDRVFHYLPFCFAGSRIVLWTNLLRANPLHLSMDLANLKDEMMAAAPNYFLNVPALLERIKLGVEDKLRTQPKPIQVLHEASAKAYVREAKGESRPGDGLLISLARAVIWRKIRDNIGPNLQCLICGSAPLGEETQRWFEMLGIPVYQVYGLTETTAIVTMDEPRQARAGFVGSAIPGVEMRVADDGELQVRGPNSFPGYFGNEAASKEAFTADGWFRTGDAGEIDDAGRLRIVGRTKNILVPTSGHNIAPEPMEQTLQAAIRGATHVVIFGHGRPYLTAVVAGDVDRGQVTAAIDALNAALPHYRRIRGFHITGETFTPESGLLTANQKLKRRALEAKFEETLAGLYGAQ